MPWNIAGKPYRIVGAFVYNARFMASRIHRELERVYWEHRQGLFTLALSITRCSSRAEDAVQDAFGRLWRLRKPPRGELTPYVFAAVRNAAIDQMRRNAGMIQPPEEVSIFDAKAEDPAASVLEAERQELVRQAVEALPDDQRQAIILHVYGGLTFDEVATMLAEPLPTIASRYRRALEKLKQALEKVKSQ